LYLTASKREVGKINEFNQNKGRRLSKSHEIEGHTAGLLKNCSATAEKALSVSQSPGAGESYVL